jgi:cell division septum initiation protein DivIVA
MATVDDARGYPAAEPAADLDDLIDRLEEVIARGSRVPLTNRVMVEEAEVLVLLEQLRRSLPRELRQARRVLQERQKIILDAQIEAQKILSTAQERAQYIMSEQGIVNEAKARCEEMLRHAKDQAKRAKGEVDLYAIELLSRVEEVLQESLSRIQHVKERVSH